MSALRATSSADDGDSPVRAFEGSNWRDLREQPRAEALLDAIEFLRGLPDPQAVCQYVSSSMGEDAQPSEVVIATIDARGLIRVVNADGPSAELPENSPAQSVAEESPLAEAIRSGRPTFHSSEAGIRELFPEFAASGADVRPTAIWPIESRGKHLGAIQLLFDEKATIAPLEADVEALLSLIALYIQLQLSQGSSRTRWSTVERAMTANGTARTQDRRRASGISELTERQSLVLDEICAGRTNAQIARIVGFSESTVRQETMAIYRALGVEGRGQAAAMARAHRARVARAATGSTPTT
ncbi:MAG: hypothetical protein RL205_1624 [Actinomycetota bacterium]|jgi:DNA-binding CsgD family transcriptional regulator